MDCWPTQSKPDLGSGFVTTRPHLCNHQRSALTMSTTLMVYMFMQHKTRLNALSFGGKARGRPRESGRASCLRNPTTDMRLREGSPLVRRQLEAHRLVESGRNQELEALPSMHSCSTGQTGRFQIAGASGLRTRARSCGPICDWTRSPWPKSWATPTPALSRSELALDNPAEHRYGIHQKPSRRSLAAGA